MEIIIIKFYCILKWCQEILFLNLNMTVLLISYFTLPPVKPNWPRWEIITSWLVLAAVWLGRTPCNQVLLGRPGLHSRENLNVAGPVTCTTALQWAGVEVQGQDTRSDEGASIEYQILILDLILDTPDLSGPRLLRFGSYRWHVTPDTWNMAWDMWQMTWDTWHMTCVTWHTGDGGHWVQI